MPYEEFARYYDGFNTAADYGSLARHLLGQMRRRGISGGIVADLGCGTGEVTLRLAQAGYDMIAVDASADMLGVLREKLEGLPGGAKPVLLLCQRLEELDLYGTIQAAVSTFDTFNHLPPGLLQAALARAALFLEPGGLLLFDVNTPYKHSEILAGSTYEVEDRQGNTCRWQAAYRAENRCVRMQLAAHTEAGALLFRQCIEEYAYTQQEWTAMLHRAGLQLLDVWDGERFGPPAPDSPRWFMAAQKPLA